MTARRKQQPDVQKQIEAPKEVEIPEPEESELIEWIKDQPDVPSVYANHVQVSAGPWDFTMILGEIIRSGENIGAKKIVQVLMSPQHAKAVAEVLVRQVTRYESRFGELPDVNRRIRDVIRGAREEASEE